MEFLKNIVSSNIYCERQTQSLLAEPANVLSNIAFFASAILIYQLLNRNSIKDKKYWLMFILIILVGIGSSLWHLLRNPYTLVLDALPIYSFMAIFLYGLLNNLLGNGKRALYLTIGFALLQVFMFILVPRDFINGSITHVVNGIGFTIFIVWLYKNHRYVNRSMIVVFLLYALAVTFRSIDNLVCSNLFIGTHFLWHLLVALTAYFAVKTLLDMEFKKS